MLKLTCSLPLLLNSSSADTSLINFCGNNSDISHSYPNNARPAIIQCSSIFSVATLGPLPSLYRSSIIPAGAQHALPLQRWPCFHCVDTRFVHCEKKPKQDAPCTLSACHCQRLVSVYCFDYCSLYVSLSCFGSCCVAWICVTCVSLRRCCTLANRVWTLCSMAPLSAERNNMHYVLDLGAHCVLRLSGSSD